MIMPNALILKVVMSVHALKDSLEMDTPTVQVTKMLMYVNVCSTSLCSLCNYKTLKLWVRFLNLISSYFDLATIF